VVETSGPEAWFSLNRSQRESFDGGTDLPQEEWSNKLMKPWQVLLRQFFILLVQFGSIHGFIEELEEIEQLSLVILQRGPFERLLANIILADLGRQTGQKNLIRNFQSLQGHVKLIRVILQALTLVHNHSSPFNLTEE
jgi:hypothetical protein